jgi:hypothetical protein
MSNVYVVVAKDKLVFATSSKKWADNFMVTLAHVKPRLAHRIAVGEATNEAQLSSVIHAFGSFPVWVDEKKPKTKRRVWTVFLEKYKPDYNTLSLISTFDQKGAEWVRDALEAASFDTVYGSTSTTDPLFTKGLLGFALLRPL